MVALAAALVKRSEHKVRARLRSVEWWPCSNGRDGKTIA